MINNSDAFESSMDLNIRLIIQLLRRAVELQNYETDVIFGAYLVEEDENRKDVLFKIYKESEIHRLIVEDIIKDFENFSIRSYSKRNVTSMLANMFPDERLCILKQIHEMTRRLYADILKEIEKIDNDQLAKIKNTLSKIIKCEEKHIELIDKLNI